MPNFDVRTVYLIIAVLYILMSVVTWGVMVTHRTTSINYWCSGSALTGLAFLFMGLRGTAPNLLAYPIANLALFAGIALHVQGLRTELKPAIPPRVWVSVTLLMGAGYTFIYYWVESPLWRLRGPYIVYILILAMLAMLISYARQIASLENSRGAKWIANVYFVVVLALAIRQVSVFTNMASRIAESSDPTMQLLVLTLVLAPIVSHLGYMGLALDRSRRREIAAAAARAREEVSRRLGAQIAQLDRQRSMGTMAITLGHELSQPLAAAMTNTQVAIRGLQAGKFSSAQTLEFLEKILHNVQRGKHIIDRIRSYVRPATTELEPVDLVEVVQEASALLVDEARNLGVHVSLAPVVPRAQVLGERIQISQVVVNILRNAMQALKNHGGGLRHIQVAVLTSAGRAIVKIADNGPGVPAEVLAQVGTPFFTTKEDGLGMGLAISRGITEHFGGLLSITPAPEGGTTVTLDFPALADGPRA